MKAVLIGFDPVAAHSILLSLRLRWPDFQVRCLEKEQCLGEVAGGEADLAVVDASLAQAVELVSELRKCCNTVIVVLASEPRDPELIEMLEAGADDYLDLFASAPLFVARISAVLRRARKAEEHPEPLACGEMRVDPLTHEVMVNGQVVHLTPTEFKLLCHMAKNKGRLVTQGALQEVMWGSAGGSYTDSLRKYVERVRHKVQDLPGGGFRIETVPRTGYRLVETPSRAG